MSTKVKSSLIVLATLLIGIVLGALSTGALQKKKQAQNSRLPHHERFEKIMERIIRPTEEQAQQIEAILDKRYDQIAGLQQSFQDQVFALYDSMRTDLSQVLTEEQQERLEKKLAEGPRSVFESRLAHLAEDLNLSPKQRREMHKIFTQFFRRDQGERFGEGRPAAGRRRGPKNFRKLQEAIAGILTQEQMEKFREIRRSRGGFMGPPPGLGPRGGFRRRPKSD